MRSHSIVMLDIDPIPFDELDDLGFLLVQQDGVISRAQALRHLSPAAIRHRLRTGRWRRAHAGVYLTNQTPITRSQRHWIAALAADAFLAGLSALEACGLRGYRCAGVHVLLPAGRQQVNPPPGVVVHRTTRLPESDLLRNGVPRTRPARSVVDAARWAATDDDACAVIAAGFQQRLVAFDDVHRVLDRLPNTRRARLIALTATDAAGGSHSLAELKYLALTRRAGLPDPSRQHPRTDASGRKRYLDIWYDEYRVHVEIDGGQHLDARASWADMKRQNDLWVAGSRVLHFPAWLVRVRPEEVVTQVRAALWASGWRPPTHPPTHHPPTPTGQDRRSW